ncbi:alpha/beta-hydrolase [Amylostereum chailletii]|nr:alpha/beta-hydrolase [Amylostereum chailletii]
MIVHILASIAFPFASTVQAQTIDALVVNTTAGAFRGVAVANGTERWLGIPFVQPPLGELRFKAPVAIVEPAEGVRNATSFGNACPQPPAASLGAPVGESCLFLNVWRPAGTAPDAELPVLFWIHGGFWMTGASSDHAFDPTRIIQRSVNTSQPIIFVSANYRLNTFGFLASTNVDGADLNAGFLDTKAALEFVQDNAAAFGGDPSKVTIWGQSAGGGTVETQVLYASGRPLFRGAIMDSSSGPFKTSPTPDVYDRPNGTYTLLTTAVGCPTSGPASLACLQNATFDSLMNASNVMIQSTLNEQIWEPAVGPPGTFLPERSSARIASGNFSHVPLIAGSNLNDGSIFATSLRNKNLTGAAQDSAFDAFVLASLIDTTQVTPDVLAKLHAVYPENDTSLGAPFNTGDSLFDRGSAFYGDDAYTASRRRFLGSASGLQKTWGYFFKEFLPGGNPGLGVPHGSELGLLFGPVQAAEELEFANTFLDFYLNFINDLDPGSAWSLYTPENKQVLQLMRGNTTMIPDDFFSERLDLLNSQQVLDAFER